FRVEEITAVFPQDFRVRQRRQLADRGLRQQDDRFGQVTVRRQVEFFAAGDGEQFVAAEDVALVVRDLQTGTGQPAVLLDDAPEDARRRQHHARVGGREQLLQVGGAEGGRGQAHGGVVLSRRLR